MPVYKYSANARNGQVIRGVIEALDQTLAMKALRGQHLDVIDIREDRFSLSTLTAKITGVNRESLVMMTRRLGTMLNSGVTLERGIQILYEQETDKRLKAVLQAVLHDIRAGSTFSGALARHQKTFSSLFVGMVKVGEATGSLNEMMDRLADFLERDYRVRKQTQSALMYPAFVFGFCMITVFVIFIYVLPNMLNTLTSLGGELPAPTRITMAVLKVIRNPYGQLGIITAIIYYVIYMRNYLKTPLGRLKWSKLILHLPIISSITRKLIVASFARALGTLMTTGVPIVRSLTILMDFIDNEYFNQFVVKKVQEGIKEGRTMAEMMEETAFFPPMVVQMISVGETTGELPQMLGKMSAFYDLEIVYMIEAFLNMLEPLMIGSMGILVCFILVSVFMPLYSLIMKMT